MASAALLAAFLAPLPAAAVLLQGGLAARGRRANAECPVGYRVVVGDVPGWAGYAHERSIQVDTVTSCASACSSRPDCKFFGWDPGHQLCSINGAARAKAGSFEDSILCVDLASQAAPLDVGGTKQDMRLVRKTQDLEDLEDLEDQEDEGQLEDEEVEETQNEETQDEDDEQAEDEDDEDEDNEGDEDDEDDKDEDEEADKDKDEDVADGKTSPLQEQQRILMRDGKVASRAAPSFRAVVMRATADTVSAGLPDGEEAGGRTVQLGKVMPAGRTATEVFSGTENEEAAGHEVQSPLIKGLETELQARAEDEDEDEDEAEEDEDEAEEGEEESEEDDEDAESEEGGSKVWDERRVVNAGRNLVWQKLMPAEEGTARSAAEAMQDLPPADGRHPEDAQHAELYLRHFTDDRELDGQPPPGASRKQALRWLHAALHKFSEGDHRYQLPAKYLLGSWRLWPDNQNGKERQFVELKRLAEKKLDVIGIDFERDIFVARGLAEALGKVGASVPPARPRQDKGLPMKPNFAPDKRFEDPEDTFYMALLLTAVHAVDRRFQEQARRACEGAGGDCKGPAPKGFMRMLAKLTTDHAEAEVPRAAENIDTNRVAWTFEKPAQMRDAFERASAAFGPPVRVKNGYSAGFDALKVSKGYRNILANYRFAPEGLTWGALVKKDAGEVDKVWARLRQQTLRAFLRMGYADEQSLDPEWKHYLHDFDQAREHLRSPQMRDVPVVLVVEVQYMLRPYMDMRKKTHAWYKILRADNAEALVFDYMFQ